MKSELERLFSGAASEGLWVEQGGTVDDRSGYVAWFDFTTDDSLTELSVMADSLGLSTDGGVHLLRGYWTLREDDQGFTYIRKVDTEEEAIYWLNGQLDRNGVTT